MDEQIPINVYAHQKNLHFWMVPCVPVGIEHTQGMCSGLALAHGLGWITAMEQCATDQAS